MRSLETPMDAWPYVQLWIPANRLPQADPELAFKFRPHFPDPELAFKSRPHLPDNTDVWRMLVSRTLPQILAGVYLPEGHIHY